MNTELIDQFEELKVLIESLQKDDVKNAMLKDWCLDR